MKKIVSPDIRIGLIPELPPRGGRLGRHIEFDERSRLFAVARPKKASPIVTREWGRKSAAFQQGAIGSCVGNSIVGCLATAPFAQPRRTYNEKLAVRVYTIATQLDSIEGAYPAQDTGSTILAGCKAAVRLGLAVGYEWCFGGDDVRRTLSARGPVAIGINWYDGFDQPNSAGRVSVSGRIRGGHAFELIGVDAEHQTVTAVNSWGPSYGVRGRFVFSWDDLDRLLAERGEAALLRL